MLPDSGAKTYAPIFRRDRKISVYNMLDIPVEFYVSADSERELR